LSSSRETKADSAALAAVFPGMRWGAGAFAIYVAYDKLIGGSRKADHH